jgi:hypothetical protein
MVPTSRNCNEGISGSSCAIAGVRLRSPNRVNAFISDKRTKLKDIGDYWHYGNGNQGILRLQQMSEDTDRDVLLSASSRYFLCGGGNWNLGYFSDEMIMTISRWEITGSFQGPKTNAEPPCLSWK